jgi:ribonucleoside-diphosphate reductase alpha chain
MSKGLTRSRTDRFSVMQGGASPSPLDGEGGARSAPGGASASGGGRVTALSSARTGDTEGATALKPEEQKLSPAQALENLPWQKPDAKAVAAERRAEAKARGYEGEMCGECGNFTLVRNGTCMKCDTCGSTTGCS